jgi:hypothetical protein
LLVAAGLGVGVWRSRKKTLEKKEKAGESM